MRIKFTRLIALIVVLANVVVIYYSINLFIKIRAFKNPTQITLKSPTTTKSPVKHASKLVTIIIRDFELHENDVPETVQSILNFFPTIKIYILYETKPYPPLQLNSTWKTVQEVNLSPVLKVPFIQRTPLLEISTPYVLFVPDSTRITSRQNVQGMLAEIHRQFNSVVVAPFRTPLRCLRINVNSREWSLKYSTTKANVCDAVGGKHLLMMETEQLKKLTEPFLQPLPMSIYIQSAPLFIKVRILKNLSFHEGKLLHRTHHSQWVKKQIDAERLKHLYKLFDIKQVFNDSGAAEWFGCARETPRCFGPIFDQTPSYLYEGKWTPPCCLSNLRKTATHVFNHLDVAGIRYWLEAGSLLGAMRSGDVLPWDHDVDVGFNRDDLGRSTWLKRAKDRPLVDDNGFFWEKATEGNFYRVHFSKVNKVHVNLFPFFSKNGTMTKDAWYTHHENMEFPENYLHPMSSIDFIGRQVPAPNNIRDFLEQKYGKGAIEMPQYPNPDKLPFP